MMALAFLNYMDRHLIFPILGLIAKDFDISEDQLGALATGFFAVYACAAPLTGIIADRVSRKMILLVALVAWSIVTALSGLAVGFASLLVFRSLTGLGEGGYFPTALSLIGDFFGPTQRGRAIALHGVCTTLGGSAGYAIGGVLGEKLGWRGPFLLAVVPGLALAAVVAIAFREPTRGAMQETPAVAVAMPLVRRSYLRIVTSRGVVLMSLSACAASFAMNGLNTFFPLYLQRERHVSVGDAGILTGLLFAATILGQLSGGFLSDVLAARTRAVRPALVALPYLLAAPAVAALVEVPALAVALACYGVAQLGRGFAEPNIYGTIIDTTSPLERGSAQGFLLLLTFAGSTISPFVTGSLIRHGGYRPAIFVLAAGAAAASALSALLFVLARRDAKMGAPR
jgi:predicted MFS family arabinose efflux permease